MDRQAVDDEIRYVRGNRGKEEKERKKIARVLPAW
jgi:hypothetical protein